MQLRNHLMGFHRNDYNVFYKEAMEEKIKAEAKVVDFRNLRKEKE